MNSRTLPHSSVKSTALSVKAWGTRGSLPMPLTPAEIERRIDQICRDLLAAAGTRPLQKAELETWLPSFLGQRAPHLMGGYGGNTSCYEVYSAAQGLSLVIDAGTGIRALGQEWMQGACGQGQGPVHLLFTHFHWDHILGLPFLLHSIYREYNSYLRLGSHPESGLNHSFSTSLLPVQSGRPTKSSGSTSHKIPPDLRDW